MKKIISVLLSTVMTLSMITLPAMANKGITVTLDGKEIMFDVQPQLINERTMVPLRAIFEALDAEVLWTQETKTVTSSKDKTVISMSIDNPVMTVNGQSITLDTPPCIIDERTLVPVRAISEAFDLNVDWEQSTQTVVITTKGTVKDDTPTEEPTPVPTVAPTPKPTPVPTVVPTQEPVKTTGTLNNPYGATEGINIGYNEYSFYPDRTVSIKCTNVIRGARANSLAKSENRFNDDATSTHEWCFMEFNVKFVSSTDGVNDVLDGSDVIYKDTFFTSTGSSINVKDMATLGDVYGGYGVFDTEFYPGGSGKVVIGILIPKETGSILLRVPNKSNNTNSWILCYEENDVAYKEPTNQSTQTPVKQNAFDILKNDIIKKGTYSSKYDSYNILDISSTGTTYMLSYDATDDEISFSSSSESSSGKSEFFHVVMISNNGDNPWAAVTMTSSSSEYKMFVNYKNGSWVIVNNNFPSSMKNTAYELMKTVVSLFDVNIQKNSSVSLADFGITY